MSLQTPILFLIFNRFDTTQLVFEKIKVAQPPRLYIAGDGARASRPEEEHLVTEIRNWVLANVNWNCEVFTLFRTANLGCAKAVSSGIDWFFENEEMGIILEDDCLPDDSFFQYCEELLIKYRTDTRVMHIGGSNLLTNSLVDNKYSYYFSKYANVWGWASWRRAWKNYDLDLKNFIEIRERQYLKYYFNYYPAYVSRLKWYSEVMNVPNDARTFDTWDYQWCCTCSTNAGLAIVPKKNLIKNIGFGANATHTGAEDAFFSQNAVKIDLPLSHPPYIIIDNQQDKAYEQRIFGGLFGTYKMILIDFLRKCLLKRNVSYLKHL